MKSRDFLKQLRHDDIVAAIQTAEQKCSGEIRVFVSRKQPDDPVAAAQRVFEQLGMTNTRERNGVLIFVAPLVQKFAVLGDTAIHARCGEEFWGELASEMAGHFRHEQFTEGIVHAIHKTGELLARHFPHQPDDRNELSDSVAHD